MRPPSESWHRRSGGQDAVRSVMRVALPALLAAGGPGCAPRDAQVGAAPAVDAGGSADASGVPFASELAANGGVWDVFTPIAGESVTFGTAHAGARDGLVAELRFPGDPALTATDRADPDLNAGIATRQSFRFGTFRARVQFATCAPAEEVASAVFMYFSDGLDGNANGITDEQELDLQVLCGSPSFIVLTA